LINFL